LAEREDLMRWNDDRERAEEEAVPEDVKRAMAAIKEKMLAENPDAEIIMKAVPISKAGGLLKQLGITPEELKEIVEQQFDTDKFDPENDPLHPEKGDLIKLSEDHPFAGTWEIAHVEWGVAREMLAAQEARGGTPDPKGYDRVFFRSAASNPFILWAAYCYKLLED
jgi:hypothetical protein